jgi:hypothetical protein
MEEIAILGQCFWISGDAIKLQRPEGAKDCIYFPESFGFC